MNKIQATKLLKKRKHECVLSKQSAKRGTSGDVKQPFFPRTGKMRKGVKPSSIKRNCQPHKSVTSVTLTRSNLEKFSYTCTRRYI